MILTDQDESFPILSELDLEQVKAAMEKVDYSKAPVVLPKGMTSGNYQDMNILPGNRIGWQQKQEHLHRLSDLYTLGYLTEKEYEKRMEWVNSAQTIEQVNIVFTDLREILSAEAGSYLKPAPAEEAWWMSILVLLTAGIVIATYIMLSWPAELLAVAGTVILAAAVNVYHHRK